MWSGRKNNPQFQCNLKVLFQKMWRIWFWQDLIEWKVWTTMKAKVVRKKNKITCNNLVRPIVFFNVFSSPHFWFDLQFWKNSEYWLEDFFWLLVFFVTVWPMLMAGGWSMGICLYVWNPWQTWGQVCYPYIKICQKTSSSVLCTVHLKSKLQEALNGTHILNAAPSSMQHQGFVFNKKAIQFFNCSAWTMINALSIFLAQFFQGKKMWCSH